MRNPLTILLLLGLTAAGCWQSAPETPVSRGKAYFDAGDWDRAISAFDEAISRNPLDAEAYLFRGQAYMCRGREHVGQALADYSEAIRLDPKNYEAYYHRAIAYRERGEKQ
jgi:tetratricopeptide (TPR) repeat protein